MPHSAFDIPSVYLQINYCWNLLFLPPFKCINVQERGNDWRNKGWEARFQIRELNILIPLRKAEYWEDRNDGLQKKSTE